MKNEHIESVIKFKDTETAPDIKIYATGSGLGYKEYAYLIRISDKYLLCVGMYADQNAYPQMYRVGDIVEDDGLLYLEDVPRNRFRICESPLWGTFLLASVLYELMLSKI